jgi:biopolymer transport protein ExbD
MAANGPENAGGIISGINVTPLVDIVLVLLIIFMVTAHIIATPALPADLPRARETEIVQMVLSVVLLPQGPVLVNGQKTAGDGDVIRLAREALTRDRETRAVINADGAVPHRRVIHTLDLLRQAGISRVAFGALPEEPGK